MQVSDEDREVVAELLGRRPEGDFEVVVRDDTGTPRVIRNAPIQYSGRPMPTLYWLVSERDRLVVSRLESSGYVDIVEAEVDADALDAAHRRYEAERDSLIPDDFEGHRPSNGVAGTRVGVKCLHAHYAYHLAGGDDPVGQWVADRLAIDPEGDGSGLPPDAPRTDREKP